MITFFFLCEKKNTRQLIMGACTSQPETFDTEAMGSTKQNSFVAFMEQENNEELLQFTLCMRRMSCTWQDINYVVDNFILNERVLMSDKMRNDILQACENSDLDTTFELLQEARNSVDELIMCGSFYRYIFQQ